MELKFDALNNFELPLLTLCNPNGKELGIITPCKFKFKPKFNAVSNISITLNKIENENIFDKIEQKRYVKVENIGEFIIDTSSDNYEKGNEIYKDIDLISCEIELSYFKINYFKGTYKFYNKADSSNNLLGMLMQKFPKWTIGTVDSNVAKRYRTFDVPNDTVYSFLMNDVEKAYECLIEFDIMNRIVNVYDRNNYINATSIFLTQAETINSLEIKEQSDEIITALRVIGDNHLNISSVNPIGSSVIYNFDYYNNPDWFSPELIDAVTAWKVKISQSKELYTIKNNILSEKNSELLSFETELTELNKNLSNYKIQQSTYISGNNQSMLTKTNEKIKEITTSVRLKELQVDSKKDEITQLENEIKNIVDSNSIQNNFNDKLFSELSCFIRQENYKNDNITINDTMTYSEKQKQAQLLYDTSLRVLNKASQANCSCSIKTTDFIFQKNFLPYTHELKTGCLINIEKPNRQIAQMLLLKMSIDFISKKCSFNLGEQYRLNDAESLYSDLYNKTSRSANSVDFERSLWGKPIKSGQLEQAVSFTQASLDVTNNKIKSSTGQDFTIDNTGINLIKKDEDGEISDEQIKLTNNTVAITDDNFDTLKTAIGRIYLPDGKTIDGKNYIYGINANYLVGKQIIGEGLSITTADGNFTLDENGLHSDQMSTLEKANQDINTKISSLEQDAHGINIKIEDIQAKGTTVDQVVTSTGYSFDENGLLIQKSGEEISNLLDSTGMCVKRSDEKILTANNKGVEAINLTAKQYLIIGKNSRFEDYKTGNNDRRTACFAI